MTDTITNSLATARDLAADLADQIAAQLAGDWPDLTVSHAWTLPRERDELAQPLVNITPASWENSDRGRRNEAAEIQLELAIAQALTVPAAGLDAALETFLDLVQDLVALWQLDGLGQPGPLRHATVAGAEFVRLAQPEILNPDYLAQDLALATLLVTYRAELLEE